MPIPPVEFEPVGYVELRIPDRGGTVTAKTVDLFNFYDRLHGAGREHVEAGRHGEAIQARQEFLRDEGFPDVSGAMAVAVLRRLSAEVEAVQKKDPSPASAGSPGTSGSPSGTTARESTPPA